MKLTDIENLPYEELKSRRTELVKAAGEAEDSGDVFERFVDARTDAKQRDLKLAKQGNDILGANLAYENCKVEVAELKSEALKSSVREKELEQAIETQAAKIMEFESLLAKL